MKCTENQMCHWIFHVPVTVHLLWLPWSGAWSLCAATCCWSQWSTPFSHPELHPDHSRSPDVDHRSSSLCSPEILPHLKDKTRQCIVLFGAWNTWPLWTKVITVYRFGTTCGWVNNDRIFMLPWTIPLNEYWLFYFLTCDRIDLKQSQIGIGYKQGAVGSHTDSQRTSTSVFILRRAFESGKKKWLDIQH